MTAPVQEPGPDMPGASSVPADCAGTANASLLTGVVNSPQLAGCWQDVALRAGETLFDQGDEGDAFYLVSTGCLEVSRREEDGTRVTIAHLHPGAHVGEMALIDGGPRTASVECLADARLRRLMRDDFLAALSSCPELGELTAIVVTHRLRRVLDYIGYLTRWARAVARGDYDEARSDLFEQADAAPDPNAARFASTFLDMIAAVQAREEALRRELDQLRIQFDRQRQASEVGHITEAESFRALQVEADRLRRRVREAPER